MLKVIEKRVAGQLSGGHVFAWVLAMSGGFILEFLREPCK
jgi:hypothetical protein